MTFHSIKDYSTTNSYEPSSKIAASQFVMLTSEHYLCWLILDISVVKGQHDGKIAAEVLSFLIKYSRRKEKLA